MVNGAANTEFPGVAEKRDELSRSSKHPAPVSSPDSATPISELTT